ncbi:MAG TPA: choice-of-anchor Q domain-containing protein [Dokdonella sp.]
MLRCPQPPLRAGVLLAAAFAAHVHATDAVVGPAQCDEAGFAGVLATVDASGGGTITFACGGATTIAFTGFKTISNAVTIDGAGAITFDGGGSSAFFQVFASATVVLKALRFERGAFNAAHALENFGTLTLDRVVVADTVSDESAFANYGTAFVRDSTFEGNAANSSTSGDGGAIGNLGSELHVSSSTFSANAARNGAAIYSTAPLVVVNSTFTGNTASGGGAAIYQTDVGAASVAFATIVGNSALFGGGLYNDGGGSSSLTLGSSLLGANAGGSCDGVIQSAGYNLDDEPTQCGATFTGPGDVLGASLPMQPLGDYGGPTPTMPPASGNAAINHVPISACTAAVDQRGAGRPFGSACDSGAVELGGALDVIFVDGFDG